MWCRTTEDVLPQSDPLWATTFSENAKLHLQLCKNILTAFAETFKIKLNKGRTYKLPQTCLGFEPKPSPFKGAVLAVTPTQSMFNFIFPPQGLEPWTKEPESPVLPITPRWSKVFPRQDSNPSERYQKPLPYLLGYGEVKKSLIYSVRLIRLSPWAYLQDAQVQLGGL